MTPPSEMLVSQAALVAELMDAALEKALQSHGISHRTFELLSAIKAAGGQVAQAEVARRLGITPPSLTEGLRPLVKSGLVSQQLVPSDNRVKRLQLTELGEAKLALALHEIAAIDRAITAELDGNQLKIALGALRRAARVLVRLSSSESESNRE